ncbi:MAG: hypothetical protein U0234_06445 [Sandaracinus sp.]
MREARLTESPLRLVRRAAGSRAELRAKVRRLARALATLRRPEVVEARLERLRALGYVDIAPTPVQMAVGSIDMLRFWISPAAAEYYASRGIGYGFHQILRILEEPATMVDPTGLLTERDVIIDHLLQVVHANPAYDLQLLEAHEDGLAELEAQTEAAIAGTHPKSRSLAATVEDEGYYPRLLGYVRAFRQDRDARAPLRSNIAGNAQWAPIERTFGTLPAALRYFARMPRTPLGGAWHLATVRRFPRALAEP